MERSVFMKEVKTHSLWTFELGTQKTINVPVWIIVGFQQRDRQDSQNLNNDTFYRPPLTSAQCIIGTEKYLDNSILLSYDNGDYIQRHGQIKEAFRAVTKNDIPKTYISDIDFRSCNDDNEFGYNVYVFDIRKQNNFENAQPIKVEFKFSANIPAGIHGYASILTKRLVSISSDGEHHFDLL